MSMLTPGDNEALQGTTGATGGHTEHPRLMDTDAMGVLCFLQCSFIPSRFQQTLRTQSLSYHCRNLFWCWAGKEHV